LTKLFPSLSTLLSASPRADRFLPE
jgi:hypothetical protein